LARAVIGGLRHTQSNPTETKSEGHQLSNQIKRLRNEKGFTLIELLVVIVILGILAAVVVFAVAGVGDKGSKSACKIDTRTLRTAEEAYYAQDAPGGGNGTYTSSSSATPGPLVPTFLAEASKYHTVTRVVGNAAATPPVVEGYIIHVADTKCGTAVDDGATPADETVVNGTTNF
jgi:general secretion pathway protein G